MAAPPRSLRAFPLSLTLHFIECSFSSVAPELLRAFALGRFCRTGPILAVPSEDCRARPASVPLPRPASPETARH